VPIDPLRYVRGTSCVRRDEGLSDCDDCRARRSRSTDRVEERRDRERSSGSTGLVYRRSCLRRKGAVKADLRNGKGITLTSASGLRQWKSTYLKALTQSKGGGYGVTSNTVYSKTGNLAASSNDATIFTFIMAEVYF